MSIRRTRLVAVTGITLAASIFLGAAAAPAERKSVAVYTATVSDVPAGTAKLDLWIPLPLTRGAQKVTDRSIDSPYKWTIRRDSLGNEYAHASIANPPSVIETRVKFGLERREQLFAKPAETKSSAHEISRSLAPDRLVTLSPRVRKLAEAVTEGRTAPLQQARAIYDHVLASMKYDKAEPGWGKGDTERACDVGKGNCTDFHSLFMSLARAKEIPSRFVIGFPMTSKEKRISGYHCWAEFWVNGEGWIPVDASDASKSGDSTIREYLFGNLDADRVQFTTGRDLVLEPPTNEPLNFFIYPHAEAAGKPVGATSIALEWE
jgi:transglutaminase-like putative cysteine protease